MRNFQKLAIQFVGLKLKLLALMGHKLAARNLSMHLMNEVFREHLPTFSNFHSVQNRVRGRF